MATIVQGLATSHTPLVSLSASQWLERGRHDMSYMRLNTIDGRQLSYSELVAERGEPYRRECALDRLVIQEKLVQHSLDRLADDLARAAPDVVLVIGDDQGELFGPENFPAIAIYYGRDVAMHPLRMEGDQEFWKPVLAGYGMDGLEVYEGAPELARELIGRLIEHGIDVAAAASVPDASKRGFGHAFGFIAKRLFGGRRIPLLPLLFNTYFPPNAPTPSRSYQVGQILRRALEESSSALRVCIVASGGLSHFLCEEELDRRVLDAIRRKDGEALGSLPRAALSSGSSEILNWIVAAGALEALDVKWSEYVPVYRTPAGSGVGMGFMSWERSK